MAESSNSSFIPKRGSGKIKRRRISGQVYFFTTFSYVLMFATVLSAGGVFAYTNHLEGQLEAEIEALNSEISTFDDSNMQSLIDFDARLSQAADRLNNNVSMDYFFSALEVATVDTAQIETMKILREGDEHLQVTAQVLTNSFDSTIFQKDIYKEMDIVSKNNILDVNTSNLAAARTGEGSSEDFSRISFNVELSVPLSAIPYRPPATTAPTQNSNPESQFPATIEEEVSSEEVGINEVAEQVDSQENDI